MALKRKKRKTVAKRGSFLGTLFVLLLFALNAIAALTALTPRRYAVTVGAVSEQTITAARTVEDTAATEAQREQARENVKPVYTQDTVYAQSLIEGTATYFAAVRSLVADAEEIRSGSAPADGEDQRTWPVVIPQDEFSQMLKRLPQPITDTALGYALLDFSEDQIDEVGFSVIESLTPLLNEGVTGENLAAVRAELSRTLQITTYPTRLKELGELAYDAYLQPTVRENAQETMLARERAAAAVEPVTYSRGAVIVKKGDTVTEAQMSLLLRLDAVEGVGESAAYPIGVTGSLLCAYVVFFAFLRSFRQDVLYSGKKMLLLLTILAPTILLRWGFYYIDPRLSPSMLAVLLCALLLDAETAMGVNVLLAASFGLLSAGSGSAVFGADCFISALSSLVAGQIAIRLTVHNEHRSACLVSGATGGAAAAVCIACCTAALQRPLTEILTFSGFGFLAPFLLSVFCVGLLPMLENLFDAATVSRMNELLNGNHPLLKRMMVSAPGTYHHSMLTASLAEAAAETVGASPTVARAGGMYHDAGKLRRPSYFKENQTNQNIHDTLKPEESAEAIIAHQRDADVVLSRYHVPGVIKQIAREHHGTTLVAYFYYKAKSAYGEENVQESQYRYPGPTPSTKEAGIVMLADSCEAAVRSLTDPSAEDVAEMVHKIFRGKLEDGQLVNCPLTLAELDRIEKSFLLTFGGLMHERIRYPDEEAKAIAQAAPAGGADTDSEAI